MRTNRKESCGLSTFYVFILLNVPGTPHHIQHFCKILVFCTYFFKLGVTVLSQQVCCLIFRIDIPDCIVPTDRLFVSRGGSQETPCWCWLTGVYIGIREQWTVILTSCIGNNFSDGHKHRFLFTWVRNSQQSEIIVLNWACQLAKNQMPNFCNHSSYALGVAHNSGCCGSSNPSEFSLGSALKVENRPQNY